MRVLHVTLSFEPGGRRVAIQNLAAGLAGLGIESALCCLSAHGCGRDQIEPYFARDVELERRRLLDTAAISAFDALCREREIDVVHSHDAASLFFVWEAGWLRGRHPSVTTFHRSLGFETRTLRDRLRNAIALAGCAAVITASTERREHYRRENFVARDKVLRVPLGIDTEKFSCSPAARAELRGSLGIGADELVVGAIGHYGEEKGIDVVVEAIGELVRRRPRAQVRLLVLGTGDGAEQTRMQSLVSRVAPERVTLLGFRSDSHRWFSAFDVFAHAPRLEAFGLVLIEAMASGLPVIATRVGGVPDIVTPDTGTLVEPEDPAALAAALETLLDDRERRSRLGLAAQRRTCTEYSLARYAERHRRIYELALAKRRLTAKLLEESSGAGH